MLRSFCALQLGLLLACIVANGQSSPGVAQLPYTAQFKYTTVKTLADGSTSTSEHTSIKAADSHGRFSDSTLPSSVDNDSEPRTGYQVRDLVHLTVSRWTVPGTTAQVIYMPDIGEPETDCAKRIKAIGPLHPLGTGQTPIEDLGTKTFLGIEARGGRISFTPKVQVTSGQAASDTTAPLVRTNEVWTATDPRLGGLVVYQSSTTSQGTTTTRELTEFTQAEPDPQLFEIPADRQIVRSETNAYVCGPDGQPKSWQMF
jgi:hypothetical protein